MNLEILKEEKNPDLYLNSARSDTDTRRMTESKPKKMTDEERQNLVQKLDEDLDAFIEERKASQQNEMKDSEPYNTTVEGLVAELKQHPAFMTEFDPSQAMSPEMEGLQKMKYESDSAEVNADSYKDDGNDNFKRKKYRWAKDSYTKGIQEKCCDRLLNAVLYSNRAAAHYRLGNFRSSFTDCIMSRKFKSDHVKAIYRGAQCSVELKKFGDAIKWCDSGLILDPKDDKFLQLRANAGKLQKQQERDERKAAMKERKEKEQQRKLVETIKDRGIRLANVKPKAGGGENRLVLSSLESHHPSGCKVHVDDQGLLHWPVLLVYPEYGQTDLIESFNENTRFCDHLESMFGVGTEPSSWDEQHKYKPHNLQMYFEHKEKENLCAVDLGATLSDTLKDKRCVVYGGTPSYIVIVKGSAFAKHFLGKYNT